jgi:hypothetical protein
MEWTRVRIPSRDFNSLYVVQRRDDAEDFSAEEGEGGDASPLKRTAAAWGDEKLSLKTPGLLLFR